MIQKERLFLHIVKQSKISTQYIVFQSLKYYNIKYRLIDGWSFEIGNKLFKLQL